MAQHDYNIANQSGAAFRADLNNALSAIVTLNSGSAEPSTTFAYQLWADTTAGVLKIRNGANNAWITLRELDGTMVIEGGSASTPGLYFSGDANTGIYSPGADQLALSTGGTGRLFVDASGRLGIGTSSPGTLIDISASNGMARIGSSSGNNIFQAYTGSTALGMWAGGAPRFYSTGSIIFSVNATAGTGAPTAYSDAMTIDSSGNVIINSQGDLRFGDSDNSNWVALQAPATVSSNVTLTLPATDGTADQVLKTNGSGALGWATLLAQGSAITAGTSVASTSGTSIDFTGLPSWVKRITVMFDGVSTNGTSPILVQIGDSGGIETTGYESSSSTGGTTSTSTSGLVIRQVIAGDTGHGLMTIALLGSNAWVSSHNLHRTNTDVPVFGAGSKTLSDTLTQVRITTVNGTDTFDAGTINIMYEG